MADAIRRRMVRQDEFTDDQAELTAAALRRYTLRVAARDAWAAQRVDALLADDLDIPVHVLAEALHRPFFGAAWAGLERISPCLQRHRVRFVELPAEIARAQAILRRLAPVGLGSWRTTPAETLAAE